MVHFVTISPEALNAIMEQGGTVNNAGKLIMPEGTETTALGQDLSYDNIDRAEFVLPDGLVIYLEDRNIHL